MKNDMHKSGSNHPDICPDCVKPLDRSFTAAVTGWYVANRRDLPWRQDKEPYHVWVSEIMLQQTRVEAVRDYYLRFMKALPTVEALAEADEEQLLKLWQGLGYYNRVRNMQKAARQILQKPSARFPDSFQEILALSGIGEYTAGAIASICFDQRTPAVDGNVLRVMARITEEEDDVKSSAVKRKITDLVAGLYPETGCGDFTQALIELGALICVPNGKPRCEVCPAAGFCRARAAGRVMELPVKPKKKARRQEQRTVFILTCGEKVAVRQRPEGSLLGSLFEFPQAPRLLTADEAVSQAGAWGCRPLDVTRSRKYKHIFTHVEWDMTGYYITCGAEGPGEPAGQAFRWVTWDQVKEEIPLPSAFQPFCL